ncbi:TPA: S49 family peptidase [Vibrio parahaemolyticus]
MFKKWFGRKKDKPEPGDLAGVVAQESAKHLRVSKFKAAAIGSGLLLSVAFTFSDTASESIGPHVAVVNLNGAIETGSRETDGWRVSRILGEAMDDDSVRAIVIEANSPGGSPADAEHIYKTILSYRHSNNNGKPIYVSVRGVCASACYFIAAAADEIYAMNSSLIGSIGVRMDGWDFQKVMNKVGVERRVFHAGEHKALLDPFKPITEEERAFIQDKLLTKLHHQFIHSVKEGRGERLVDDNRIFSGLIWTGEEAVDLGLIDGVKTPTELEALIESRHGVTKYIYHGRKKFKLTNLFSMDASDLIDSLGASIYHAFKNDVKSSAYSYNFE